MAGKKTGKRLLTWVLVLVMALSLLPLNALAEENDVPENTNPSIVESEENRGILGDRQGRADDWVCPAGHRTGAGSVRQYGGQKAQ